MVIFNKWSPLLCEGPRLQHGMARPCKALHPMGAVSGSQQNITNWRCQKVQESIHTWVSLREDDGKTWKTTTYHTYLARENVGVVRKSVILCSTSTSCIYWLVVSNIVYFPQYMGCCPSFFKMVIAPPTRWLLDRKKHMLQTINSMNPVKNSNQLKPPTSLYSNDQEITGLGSQSGNPTWQWDVYHV